MDLNIGGILREYRKRAGLSVEEVLSKLLNSDIKISSKALYNYETAYREPDVDTFMALCKIYQIDDILGAFGYGQKCNNFDDEISEDAKEVARAYDKAEFKNKNNVRYILDIPLLPESDGSPKMTSSACDKQNPPISERVAEAEEEYIKSVSAGARKTASSASTTTDGKNEKAV